MLNIETILEGIELTDENRQAIIEGVKANYKTIAEVEGKANRISELESELQKRDDAIANLQGSQSETEALRQQVAEYQAKDAKRQAEEAEREKLDAFTARFDKAMTKIGKEFANDLTRQAVLAQAQALCEADADLAVADAINGIVGDDQTYWKNPQREVMRMPTEIDSTADIEAKKKDMASRIFGSSLINDKE